MIPTPGNLVGGWPVFAAIAVALAIGIWIGRSSSCHSHTND